MERRHTSKKELQQLPLESTSSGCREETPGKEKKKMPALSWLCSTRMIVLLILCLQNSMFTLLRRYSQGVLKEIYSKVRNHERYVPFAG